MSRISIIAAVDHRMAIGFQNKLLFWLPNDLKRFKALTTGNTIIMGRKLSNRFLKERYPIDGMWYSLPIRQPNVPEQRCSLRWKPL